MEMSVQESIKLFPSNAIFRIALLKWVSGSILQKGCNQVEKLSIEKKGLVGLKSVK